MANDLVMLSLGYWSNFVPPVDDAAKIMSLMVKSGGVAVESDQYPSDRCTTRGKESAPLHLSPTARWTPTCERIISGGWRRSTASSAMSTRLSRTRTI